MYIVTEKGKENTYRWNNIVMGFITSKYFVKLLSSNEQDHHTNKEKNGWLHNNSGSLEFFLSKDYVNVVKKCKQFLLLLI